MQGEAGRPGQDGSPGKAGPQGVTGSPGPIGDVGHPVSRLVSRYTILVGQRNNLFIRKTLILYSIF